MGSPGVEASSSEHSSRLRVNANLLCRSTNQAENVSSHHEGGNAIVALSDDLADNRGGNVTCYEFENQGKPYEVMMRGATVHRPQPHAFSKSRSR